MSDVRPLIPMLAVYRSLQCWLFTGVWINQPSQLWTAATIVVTRFVVSTNDCSVNVGCETSDTNVGCLQESGTNVGCLQESGQPSQSGQQLRLLLPDLLYLQMIVQ